MEEEWVRVTGVLMYFLRISAVQSFKLQIASLSNEKCAPVHNHSHMKSENFVLAAEAGKETVPSR